ncbi:RDD family protein [Streptomyces hoynatensis]|uniref:RDD family protein n=1 Tax=Streptomyces hoynatensis TaxID=1141874 RepID=A0A3A9YV13_9ACTN|nr:RDD family protein [Streptomyces hoynatensis]RKN39790.1 RDD family protein [Streptomyces hoynatensis]
MSSPPAGNASGPGPNWYPDPSIPGYIRYWNGTAWVPGSSRPEPREGEPAPTPPSGAVASPPGPAPAQAPPQNETQPFFFDEDMPRQGTGEQEAGQAQDRPSGQSALPEVRGRGEVAPARQEGAAWRADAGAQSGPEQRVTWGSDEDVSTSPVRVDPRGQFRRTSTEGSQPPGARREPEPEAEPNEHTATLRRIEAPDGGSWERQVHDLAQQAPGAQGQAPAPSPAPGQPQPQAQGGQAAPAQSPPLGLPVPPQAGGPAQGSAPTAPQPSPQAQVPPQSGPPAGAPGVGVPPQAGSAPAAPQPSPAQGVPAQGGPAADRPPQPGPGAAAPGGYGFPQQPAAAQATPAGGGYGFPPQQPAQPGYGYPPAAGGQGAQPGGYGYPPQNAARAPQSPFLQSHEGDPLTMVRQFVDPGQKYPAGLGRRLMARIVDAILPLAAAGGVAAVVAGDIGDHIQDRVDAAERAGVTKTVWLIDGTTAPYLAMVLGAFLVAGLLFEALPVALWGTTLGKGMFRTQVLDVERQQKPSFGAALLRWLLFNVLGLLVVGIVSMVMAVRDRPWRQGWHDKAAHTFVAGNKQPG